MNEIALLGDQDDQFIVDLFNTLKSKGYAVSFLKFGNEDIPVKYKYRLIVDRASYCDEFLRSMVKSHSLKGTYVINNPFTSSCDDKIVEFNICQRLGIPYPRTVILPKINQQMDTTEQVSEPDIRQALSGMKFPIILKPHDGYAWDYVSTANNIDEAKRIYDSQKGRLVLLAQETINPKTYYRVYYFWKREPLFVRYLPDERRYVTSDYSDIKNVMQIIRDYTIRLNIALDYDFNACEWAVDENGNVFLIDALNETPELDPNSIPQEYYKTILERFVSMLEEKLRSTETNKWHFECSP